MAKPTVTLRCPANQHAGPNERIIEFSSANGGGLISFRDMPDGGLVVDVYRCDASVEVRAPAEVVAA